MTNEQYLSSYRHLEIEPGSSWQEVRRAYKRSVKKWHPDHFHNDTETQTIAAEKIKEINCAFDLLSEHYRAHGALPLPGATPATASAETDTNPPPGARDTGRRTPRSADHTTAGTTEHKTRPPSDQKKRSGVFTRLALVGLASWFAYTLWQMPDGTPTLPAVEPSPTPDNTAPPDDAANNRQPATDQSKQYFTYGSTIGDVYAIQGIPTETTDNVWRYGKSKVYFDGGKVTHWEDDPAYPLKASANPVVGRPAETVFGVGSTKDQVRAIQGQPLREWANVWEYGMSKVYFDGDRVSGWYDSALNPLQLRK